VAYRELTVTGPARSRVPDWSRGYPGCPLGSGGWTLGFRLRTDFRMSKNSRKTRFSPEKRHFHNRPYT